MANQTCDTCKQSMTSYRDNANIEIVQIDNASFVKRYYAMMSAFLGRHRRYTLAASGVLIAAVLAVKGVLPAIVVQFLIGIGAIVGAILAACILFYVPIRISNYVYRKFCADAEPGGVADDFLNGEFTWLSGVLIITLPVMVPYLIWLLGQYIQTLLHT